MTASVSIQFYKWTSRVRQGPEKHRCSQSEQVSSYSLESSQKTWSFPTNRFPTWSIFLTETLSVPVDLSLGAWVGIIFILITVIIVFITTTILCCRRNHKRHKNIQTAESSAPIWGAQYFLSVLFFLHLSEHISYFLMGGWIEVHDEENKVFSHQLQIDPPSLLFINNTVKTNEWTFNSESQNIGFPLTESCWCYSQGYVKYFSSAV